MDELKKMKTCRNIEGGWYIQNRKIILFFLVCP